MASESVIYCSQLIKQYQFTIAFAESATAGRMASEFSLTDDSGSILLGGLVCYDARLKETILGIDPAFISKYSPESAEVTRELAMRLSSIIPADIQVGVTGLTTPGGSETKEKPVGTIFIHVVIRGHSFAVQDTFNGDAQRIVHQAIDLAAVTITNALKSNF